MFSDCTGDSWRGSISFSLFAIDGSGSVATKPSYIYSFLFLSYFLEDLASLSCWLYQQSHPTKTAMAYIQWRFSVLTSLIRPYQALLFLLKLLKTDNNASHDFLIHVRLAKIRLWFLSLYIFHPQVEGINYSRNWKTSISDWCGDSHK